MAKDAGYERTGERHQARGASEPLHPRIRQRPLGRMAEAYLAELEAMVEGITEGLLVCDVTGDVLRMNRRAREIHGYPSAEEAQRTYGDYTSTFELADLEGHPIPMEQCPLARMMRGETFRKMEVRIREKHTGREWTGYCAGVPVRDERGNMAFGVLTFRDMSRPGEAEQTEFPEGSHAERALRESERRYRSIVETANEGIWLATLEGKTTWSLSFRKTSRSNAESSSIAGPGLPPDGFACAIAGATGPSYGPRSTPAPFAAQTASPAPSSGCSPMLPNTSGPRQSCVS